MDIAAPDVVIQEAREVAVPATKKLSKMEAFHAREGERAACMTFCRDTITRLADKSHLQKAQIETLLAERVSARDMTSLIKVS